MHRASGLARLVGVVCTGTQELASQGNNRKNEFEFERLGPFEERYS
jgi:hypothetical protein